MKDELFTEVCFTRGDPSASEEDEAKIQLGGMKQKQARTASGTGRSG